MISPCSYVQIHINIRAHPAPEPAVRPQRGDAGALPPLCGGGHRGGEPDFASDCLRSSPDLDTGGRP